MIIGSEKDHRSREGGAMVYPVYSRRSGGLSIGINLFPDNKHCSFDCPYCEIFPFKTDIIFNTETMQTALASAVLEAQQNSIPIKDICFSGNGEPTMSSHFMQAVTEAESIRAGLVPEAKLVIITNGTGLLDRRVFEFLNTAALSNLDLHIWLKLDAATEPWYQRIDRSNIPHGELLSRIRDFAATFSPFTIQTMICKVKGVLPPPVENTAWVQFVTELAVISTKNDSTEEYMNLRAVQIYGKARPSPEDPLAETVPAAILNERADLLRVALKKKEITTAVEVYE